MLFVVAGANKEIGGAFSAASDWISNPDIETTQNQFGVQLHVGSFIIP